MKIRHMETADVTEVAVIENKCFSQPWSRKSFLNAVQDSNAVFLVAEDEMHRVLGYIGMYVSPPEGEITNVAVAEEFRDQGCGKKLVFSIIQWAKEHGVKRIVLEVRSSNQAAIHVYRGEGFVKLGIRKDFYQFPREDADIMEWSEDITVKEELC